MLTMRLFGLFIKCPLGEATRDCPFADIRNLRSLELKFQLAEKMAVHPQCPEDIHNTHEACCRERLRQIRAPREKRMPTGTRRATWARLPAAAGQP